MSRLARAICCLCLPALVSCGYFDPLNPLGSKLADKNIIWETKLGGGVENVGRSVLETSDGGLVLVGTLELTWDKGYDLWLVKTNAPAAAQWGIEWSATFGGSDADTGSCLQPTSDGGYILLGSTRSSGAGGSDVYLVKIDADGNWQWDKTYGGSADDYGWSVECLADGYIIVGGTGSFGDDSGDAYLLRLDAEGDVVWEKTFGGPNADEGYAVNKVSDGGFAFAGYTQASFAGDDNAWLVKTDGSGNLVWERLFGTIATSPEDIPGCLQQAKDALLTSDGGYLLAGYMHPGGADSDAWLIKTDGDGNEEWEQTYGGGAWDQAEAVMPTADGGFALSGMSRGVGWNQAWLVKTDAAGNQEWENRFGGENDEWAYALEQTADEGYVLLGTTSGSGGQAYLVYCKPWLEAP
jgi:hypothetical protein